MSRRARASKCSVCLADPGIKNEIDNLLMSGVRLKKIHEAYPNLCSQYSLSRHRRHSLQPQPTESLSTLDSCRLWLTRADSTFQAATALGDHRGASQAISTATRTLGRLIEMEEKEQEAQQAAAAENDPNKPVTIADLDRITAEYLAERDNATGGVMVKAKALWLENPSFSQLILSIWKNRSILPALLAATEKYFSETVTEHVNAHD
jgi:hypothetical protein